MDEQHLESILDRFPDTHILVVGDFFLDHYLILDHALSELSLETGLEAYQVVDTRSSPGAAGTVTSNLRALDVQVTALGVIGDDGMGYELLRGLRQRGVNVEPLIQAPDRFTPTYTKPMLREADGHAHEIQRLDIKNRAPMPATLERQIIARLGDWIDCVDGIVVADQVPERNCGVLTDRVRAALAELAVGRPDRIIVVDSRMRIGEFAQAILKPNGHEAAHAVLGDRAPADVDRTAAETCGRELYRRTGRPVFLTVGADGVLVFDRQGMTHVPGIRVSGPIDIVGAGDSCMAGITASLCCGAANADAALVGNLVASITIQQIGTTGTATRQQVMDRFGEASAR
jgi:rfaE bifunctional protein kinase chain/domain